MVEQLKTLTKGSSEYKDLAERLRDTVCNNQERAVCCEANFELVGGTEVTDIADYPFVAYIHVRNGIGSYVECGASLVAEEFLVSAVHCLTSFYDWCYNPGQCFAQFRKLNKKVYREGEFKIDLLDVINGPGDSDLALIKLLTPVSKHPDYRKGLALRPVTLAIEPPEVGETVFTVGWGRTGFNEKTNMTEEESDQLLGLTLKVKSLDETLIYTEVTNDAGEITDPCHGRNHLVFRKIQLI